MSVAEEVAVRLHKEWVEAEKSKQEALRYAIEHKEHMPANYWQAEYKARQKMVAAAILAEELG